MKLKEKCKWIIAGAIDARKRTLLEHAPLPESEMYQAKETMPESARCYWEGWDSGVQDNVRDILNTRRCEK